MDPRFAFSANRPARSWRVVAIEIAPYVFWVVLRRGLALHLVFALAIALSGWVSNWPHLDVLRLLVPLLFWFLLGYLFGTGFAVVFGWVAAATLEWLHLRSWAAYLASGLAMGALIPGQFVLSYGLHDADSIRVISWSACYGLGYAVIYRYRMLPPASLELSAG